MPTVQTCRYAAVSPTRLAPDPLPPQERLSYVAQDYEAELSMARVSSAAAKEYTLPDGQSISVGEERFR